MRTDLNSTTQPVKKMAIFNNWDVIANGWYIVCPSSELTRRNPVRSFTICGQRIVFFRGADRKVRALDAYCPHMGTDLGVGKVVGNEIRCFFHHWKFNGEGACVDIPGQSAISEKARLRSYATDERYGFLWVHPEAIPGETRVDYVGLNPGDTKYYVAKSYERSCHHHVTMINGIDVQHLKTVHRLDVDMQLEVSENPYSGMIDFSLKGELPSHTVPEKIVRFFLGKNYEYTMRYHDGSLGCLTMMKGVKLFGNGRLLPELHMIFAYRPLRAGKILVQPIYLTKKREGFFGGIRSQIILGLTHLAFKRLQGEDGKVYENMRFNPNALQPGDAPVAKFIAYINRLKPSPWSLRE